MRLFKALALVFAVALSSLSTGCILRTRGTVAYTVDSRPPPPRRVYVESRPGYVWVDGYWYWGGGDWLWTDGYWVDEQPGQVYIQGRWIVRGGRHYWQPGGWRARANARGTVVVRGDGRGRRDVQVHEKRDHRDHDNGRGHGRRGKRDHRD
jgi:hypothetical protein